MLPIQEAADSTPCSPQLPSILSTMGIPVLSTTLPWASFLMADPGIIWTQDIDLCRVLGFCLVFLSIISRVSWGSLNYLVPIFPPSSLQTNLPHENNSAPCFRKQGCSVLSPWGARKIEFLKSKHMWTSWESSCTNKQPCLFLSDPGWYLTKHLKLVKLKNAFPNLSRS